MVGDSDDNDLLEEDEGEEDDPLQVTSQELRRLRMLGRQRLFAHPPAEPPLDEEDDESSPFYPLSAPSPLAPSLLHRQNAPFTPPRRQPFAPGPGRPNAIGSASMSGWRSVRLHSYWLVPVLLVAAFFLLVLLTHPQQAGAMIFIFAAIGLIQAALLFYAPNDAFWAVSVVGGFILFVSATFFVLFLPIFALILSILLLSLGGVALRERYFPVKDGTVAVMGLFGRYNRTLAPGFNLRIPGEKLLGVVETHSIRYDARMPPITLYSGEQVTLSVAITYQVIPGEEHRAIALAKDWQKPIQQQLQAVVQDEISLLSGQDFWPAGGAYPRPGGAKVYAEDEEDDQVPSPLARINEYLTHAMRQKVVERGVAVQEVKVHLLGNTRLPGSAPAAIHQAQPSHLHQQTGAYPTVALPSVPETMGPVVEGTVQNSALADPRLYLGAPAGLSAPPAAPFHPAGPPVVPPQRGANPAPAPEPMTLLSAQALAETYDAVVRRRISDLETIRRIISQFEAVAADPELSQQVPFDAAAGAHNLSIHLDHLQKRNLAQSPDEDIPDGQGN